MSYSIRFIILFCLFSLSLPVFATSPNRVFKIGVLYWSMNIPGQVAMRKGLEAEAEKINQQGNKVELIPYVAGDGSNGIEKQIEQMRQLIADKVDLIIVQPTDNAALSAPLLAANQANIPVVAYDQYILRGKLAAYVTSDNYQAGYLNGEYVAAHYEDNYSIRLILVDYPNVSSTVERVNGFFDALHAYRQKYHVLDNYNAIEPISGQKAATQILQQFPNKNSIDVIFTVNDGGGLSIVEALAKAGRNEIFIATIDGDPASVDNIRQKRLTRIDSAQFCGPLGATAMRTAYDLLSGKKVAPVLKVPVFPITQETLALYPGWLGPIPNAFEKPWPSQQATWHGTISSAD